MIEIAKIAYLDGSSASLYAERVLVGGRHVGHSRTVRSGVAATLIPTAKRCVELSFEILIHKSLQIVQKGRWRLKEVRHSFSFLSTPHPTCHVLLYYISFYHFKLISSMTVQAVPSSSISSRSSLAWRFWNKGKANGAATSTSLKPSSSSTISKKTKKDKKHKKKKKTSSRDDESNKQHRFDSVSTTIPSEVRTSSLNHSRDGSVSSTNSMTEMMPSHSYDASESFRLASASNIESIDVPRQVRLAILVAFIWRKAMQGFSFPVRSFLCTTRVN